jgi:transcriptional regulator with XRE-family HTH domain
MNIVAITKFKHGLIHNLLRQLGWSQKELARRSGLSYPMIIEFVMLRRKPSEECALRIQKAFGEAGIFLDVEQAWPESFSGLGRSKTVEQYRDIDAAHLLPLTKEALQIEAPDDFNRRHTLEEIKYAISKIRVGSQRTRAMLECYYLEGMSIQEIAEKFKTSCQVAHAAIRYKRGRLAAFVYPDAFGDLETVPAPLDNPPVPE